MTKTELERAVRSILMEQLGAPQVLSLDLPRVQVDESDRLDTGNPNDRVWTHDLLTLSQSPRLGAGLMVMEKTTFPWHLTYDEVDYIIEGQLTVYSQSGSVTAGPGQAILIPKGSQIQFSAPEFARFLYVTYPADWNNQPSCSASLRIPYACPPAGQIARPKMPSFSAQSLRCS